MLLLLVPDSRRLIRGWMGWTAGLLLGAGPLIVLSLTMLLSCVARRGQPWPR